MKEMGVQDVGVLERQESAGNCETLGGKVNWVPLAHEETGRRSTVRNYIFIDT